MASDLMIVERSELGIATIMARKGVSSSMIGNVLKMNIADGPRLATNAALTLVGTGPGVWLAITERPTLTWSDELRASLKRIASVSEQSGGFAIFRITGTAARSVLQRGLFIDLDPRVFVPGSVATTVAAHIGLIVWRQESAFEFDVAVFRSFSHSFLEWLRSAAL